jgi:hypothetical protein
MLAVGEVHPTVVAAEVPMAVVVAVLTGIAKASEISIFQKGPSLSNAAGFLFSSCLQSLANPTRGSATLFVRAG